MRKVGEYVDGFRLTAEGKAAAEAHGLAWGDLLDDQALELELHVAGGGCQRCRPRRNRG